MNRQFQNHKTRKGRISLFLFLAFWLSNAIPLLATVQSPINNGVWQSDQNAAGFKLLNLDLAGTGVAPITRTLHIGPDTFDLSADRTFLANVTNDAQTKASVVPNTAPAAGRILVGNAGGTAYAPVALSGSGATFSLSSLGVLSVSAVQNSALQNSSITIAGNSTALGGSVALDSITGVATNGYLKRTAANTLTNVAAIPNADLANSSVTISSHVLSLGGTLSLVNSDVGLGSVTNDAQTKSAIVPNTAPGAGQILVGNAGATAYAPQTLSGSGATISLSNLGVLSVSAVQNSALANSSVTISGHSLSLGGALSLVNSDVGLASVTNDAQTKAAIVPNTAPSSGQVLIGNGTAYTPLSISGSGATLSLSSLGVLSVSAVSNAALANSAITIAGTSTSLGGSITQDTITGLSSTGIVKRTAANTLAIATAGTDYQAALSDASNIVYKDVANTYSGGQKQTFAANATNPGERNLGVSADPGTLVEGDRWYRTDTHRLREYDGTTAQSVAWFSDLSSYQPLAANLTSWAGVTRATGFDTFVATPSSANLAALLTDETGTGAAVFGNSPTIVAPTISTINSASAANLALTATASIGGSSSIAGSNATITASNAVAGASVAGAAAGGSVTITSGNAARLTSGNANGGDINLTTGTGIGTGTAGNVVVSNGAVRTPDGSASLPSYSFSNETNSGLYRSSPSTYRFSIAGSDAFQLSGSGVQLAVGGLLTWGIGNNTVGFNRPANGVVQLNGATTSTYGQFKAGTVALQSVTTPSTPTATPSGTLGTTTITYKITDEQADGTSTEASAGVTVTNANATLTGTNKVTLTMSAFPAAVTKRKIWRTATNGTSPTTTGLIGSITSGTTFDDTGLAGDSTTPPDYNKTGQIISSRSIGARVYNSADQSITNNTWTALTFNTERYDTDNVHSTSANTSRLTAQTAGRYHISGTAAFATSGTGLRYARLVINNTTVIDQTVVTPSSSDIAIVKVNTTWDMAASDYVELQVFQASGGALNVSSLTAYSPEFMIDRIP